MSSNHSKRRFRTTAVAGDGGAVPGDTDQAFIGESYRPAAVEPQP